MFNKRVSEIKRAQKSSLLLKVVSDLLLQTSLDDERLQGMFVSRVQLSPDKGMCEVFFFCSGGEEEFATKLPYLILYKPSLRSAISKQIPGRYTPNLLFKYDLQEEKSER